MSRHNYIKCDRCGLRIDDSQNFVAAIQGPSGGPLVGRDISYDLCRCCKSHIESIINAPSVCQVADCGRILNTVAVGGFCFEHIP